MIVLCFLKKGREISHLFAPIFALLATYKPSVTGIEHGASVRHSYRHPGVVALAGDLCALHREADGVRPQNTTVVVAELDMIA